MYRPKNSKLNQHSQKAKLILHVIARKEITFTILRQFKQFSVKKGIQASTGFISLQDFFLWIVIKLIFPIKQLHPANKNDEKSIQKKAVEAAMIQQEFQAIVSVFQLTKL